MQEVNTLISLEDLKNKKPPSIQKLTEAVIELQGIVVELQDRDNSRLTAMVQSMINMEKGQVDLRRDVNLRFEIQDQKIDGLREEVGGLRGEVGGLREEVGGLRGEVGGLRGEVGGLREEVGGLREEVGGLREEMNERLADMNDKLNEQNNLLNDKLNEQTELLKLLVKNTNK